MDRQNIQNYWTLDELKENGQEFVSLNELTMPATLVMKFGEKIITYWKIDGYWFPVKES